MLALPAIATEPTSPSSQVAATVVLVVLVDVVVVRDVEVLEVVLVDVLVVLGAVELVVLVLVEVVEVVDLRVVVLVLVDVVVVTDVEVLLDVVVVRDVDVVVGLPTVELVVLVLVEVVAVGSVEVVVAAPVPVVCTLSQVAVQSCALLWLTTARPAKTELPIVTESLPMNVQTAPSGDVYAENVSPTRVRRTQYGAVTAGPVVFDVVPPVATRRWNALPLPGVTRTKACVEFGASVSRIITPALAHELVFWRLATWARISPSPVSGR
jgi:hypothetical protein